MDRTNPVPQPQDAPASGGHPAGATQAVAAPTDPPTPAIAVPAAATSVAPGIGPTPGEICTNCGKPMAADQRYCLECGQRRGEPRLPIMDARAMQPALPPPTPPPKQRRRISPNATLVAGIATLLLAMGVGVLIGHSGKSGSSSAKPAVQVVKVPGAGATASTGSASSNKNVPKSKDAKTGKSNAAVQKNLAANAASGGTDTALKAAPGVKLPPATAQVGSSCTNGTSGCKGGKFTGQFFGGG